MTVDPEVAQIIERAGLPTDVEAVCAHCGAQRRLSAASLNRTATRVALACPVCTNVLINVFDTPQDVRVAFQGVTALVRSLG